MAMAIAASVTVSMAEETSGMCSGISRVSRVSVETAAGQDLRVAGHDQHVVEGQRLLDPRSHLAGRRGTSRPFVSGGAMARPFVTLAVPT